MNVLVCMPCYNEGKSLPPLLDRFAALIAERPETFRLIAVDDGSADDTRAVLETRAETMPLEVVVHPRNRGLGPAIMSGFQRALERAEHDDDVVICMDADDTHDPLYVPSMLEKIAGGADLVIASRFQPGAREVGVPPFRRLLSRAAGLVFRLTLPVRGVRDYTCGYRAYRVGLLREAMDLFGDALIERSGFACTDEVLVKLSCLTDRIVEIPFILRYDLKRGESQLPLVETILATLKLIARGRRMRRDAMREIGERRAGR